MLSSISKLKINNHYQQVLNITYHQAAIRKARLHQLQLDFIWRRWITRLRSYLDTTAVIARLARVSNKSPCSNFKSIYTITKNEYGPLDKQAQYEWVQLEEKTYLKNATCLLSRRNIDNVV